MRVLKTLNYYIVDDLGGGFQKLTEYPTIDDLHKAKVLNGDGVIRRICFRIRKHFRKDVLVLSTHNIDYREADSLLHNELLQKLGL